MKEKFNISLLIVFITLFTFSACKKKDTYDYNAILPANISITGTSTVYTNGSNITDFMVSSMRGGSTYNWTVEGAKATISSGQGTYKAGIEFALPDSDISGVKIMVQETTVGGLTGNSDTLIVDLKKVCSLTGVNDLVGNWSGDDAFYTSTIITSVADSVNLKMSNLAKDFMQDWWGETITNSASTSLIINYDNGSITIPRQYLYSTDYQGSPYDYEIEGTGAWNNCGTSPTIYLKYDVYYAGEKVGIAEKYSPAYLSTPYLEAHITLGAKKSAVASVNRINPIVRK